MTNYNDDITILEEDSEPDNPEVFVPRFEIPGERYNQDFPKRMRHSFPDIEHWKEKVVFKGEEMPRYRKRLRVRYLGEDDKKKETDYGIRN